MQKEARKARVMPGHCWDYPKDANGLASVKVEGANYLDLLSISKV